MGRRIGLMPAFQAPLEPLPGLRRACDITGGQARSGMPGISSGAATH